MSKRIWLLVIVAAVFAVSCAGCALKASLGMTPYSAGVIAECRGLDGCAWGLEVGGWRVGLSAFPDVGPLEDEDAGTTDP